MLKLKCTWQNHEDDAENASTNPAAVITESSLIVIAGSDTTSAALSNIMWCLMNNLQARAKLREEVDKYYPPGESTLNSIYHPQMRYLEAVM